MPTTICAGKLWIFFCIFCIAIIIFFGGVYVVDKINLQLMKLQIYETQLEQCSHGKHTCKIFLLHLYLKLNELCYFRTANLSKGSTSRITRNTNVKSS